MIFSKDGVRPDPSKVDALKDAEPQRSKEKVTSFLCMIQSPAEFIQMLSKNMIENTILELLCWNQLVDNWSILPNISKHQKQKYLKVI